MRRRLACFAISIAITFTLAAAAPNPALSLKRPVVVIHTKLGDIEIALRPDKAPVTVANFLKYVDRGHYNGTIFHRVIKGFMIQGGGLDAEMNVKPTDEPIKNEAKNGLQNRIGWVAMARTEAIDSATSQFFINTANNAQLNHAGPGSAFGYAVFGQVVSGWYVVERIEQLATGSRAGFQDVPLEPVRILSIKRK